MTTPGLGPRLGLGGAALGNLYDAVPDAAADETVAAAWARGIRLFDTAPLYGHGLSESRLGRALASFPRDETILVNDASYISGWTFSHIDNVARGAHILSPRGTGGIG